MKKHLILAVYMIMLSVSGSVFADSSQAGFEFTNTSGSTPIKVDCTKGSFVLEANTGRHFDFTDFGEKFLTQKNPQMAGYYNGSCIIKRSSANMVTLEIDTKMLGTLGDVSCSSGGGCGIIIQGSGSPYVRVKMDNP
jgi:hypothetical protein